MSSAAADRLSSMTIIARSPRHLPTGHAYVVPVVREIAPPRSAPSSGLW
jgi:hypothetical protein